MALLLDKQFDNSRLMVWKREEPLDDLLLMVDLTAGDKVHFAQIKNERRQVEWLLSRFLLYRMLNAYPIVCYTDYGKPYLANDSRCISITHSINMVAVMLSNTNVGIDIERIAPRATKVRHKFLTGKELDWCCTDEQHVLVWTVKESAYKLVGDGLEHTEVEIVESNVSIDMQFTIEIRKGDKRSLLCKSMQIEDNILTYIAE